MKEIKSKRKRAVEPKIWSKPNACTFAASSTMLWWLISRQTNGVRYQLIHQTYDISTTFSFPNRNPSGNTTRLNKCFVGGKYGPTKYTRIHMYTYYIIYCTNKLEETSLTLRLSSVDKPNAKTDLFSIYIYDIPHASNNKCEPINNNKM